EHNIDRVRQVIEIAKSSVDLWREHAAERVENFPGSRCTGGNGLWKTHAQPTHIAAIPCDDNTAPTRQRSQLWIVNRLYGDPGKREAQIGAGVVRVCLYGLAECSISGAQVACA